MKEALVVALVACAVAFVASGFSDSTDVPDIDPSPGSSILFVADTGNHSAAYADVADSLSMLDWDATIVAPPEAVDSGPLAALGLVSDSYHDLQQPQEWATPDELIEFDDLSVLILDRRRSDPARCTFDSEQIRSIASLVQNADHPVVVVSDFPFWRGIDPEESSDSLTLDARSLVNCPGAESIVELFEQLPADSSALFLSRSGTGVYDRSAGGIRFVQSGTPDPDVSAGMTFLRIGIDHGGLTVAQMKQSNVSLQDSRPLETLPQYKLVLDEGQLRDLYNRAPFYDRRAGWPDLLEDRTFDLPSVAGTLEFEGEIYDVSVRTRGSFGNHWGDIKKSWTVDIAGDGIAGVSQIKWILSSDRLYLNHLLVQEVNRSPVVDVLAPDVSVARVEINGRDFGAYLQYEDFDKTFLELNGFSSDAQRAGLLYRDHFGLYDIWDDPNFITVRPSRQDKTRFLPALDVTAGYDEFIRYFEPANYRPWLASQLFTGDPHQNAQNNTRFFVDLATGRYIMVSWDQLFTPIESPEKIDNFNPTSYLQFAILEHEHDEVYAIVEELLGESDTFKTSMAELRSAYLPVFVNDPYLFHSENRIVELIDALEDSLDTNVLVLGEFIDG